MGFRINGAAKYVPSTTRVERKVDDGSTDANGKRKDQQPQEEKKKTYRFEDFKKAVEDETSRLTGLGSDIKVTLEKDSEDYRVKVLDQEGHVIREMNAAEFVELQEKSKSDAVPRGKFLDQKY